MSHYYRKNTDRRRSRREKIGFYAALSICLIAVCMAVYSTYNTMTRGSSAKLTTTSGDALEVVQPVTGVPGTIPMPTIGKPAPSPDELVLPTGVSDEATAPALTEGVTLATQPDALQTMLAADLSLHYPVKGGNVLRQFSKECVYNKTLNVWKPHPAVDFACELGEEVTAMTGGEVTKVYEDKLLGNTVEITVNNVTVCCSGLGRVDVKQGDRVEDGEKLGDAGTVPCEASDKNHIHVSVLVNGTAADPLSFIGNNE